MTLEEAARLYLARMLTIVVLTILTAVSVVLMVTGVEVRSANVGAILFALVVAYLIFSFGTTRKDEVGIMSVFGRPVKELDRGSGFFFAPLGIVSVDKFPGTVFQDELPGDPEKIFQGEGTLPTGMFHPIEVKFGPPQDGETGPLATDPYNKVLVARVVPVVSWVIRSPTTFLAEMGTVANCRKLMSDKAVELVGNEFRDKTPAKATLELHDTSGKLKAKLITETATWGITMRDAYIKPIIFSKALNDAVEQTIIAGQKKKADILLAEGAAETVRLAAEARRLELIATGQAKADKDGHITELVPDATTRAQTDSLKSLAALKGSLVLGNATAMLGINPRGDQS